MAPILNGLLTGLFLQLAVGPVFFYVLGITLERSLAEGLAAALAVTLVDFLYIGLSIAGLGRLLEKEKARRIAGLAGAAALLAFGSVSLYGALAGLAAGQAAGPAAIETSAAQAELGIAAAIAAGVSGGPKRLLAAFAGAFVLTLSSPLTIVFWSGVFSARAAEKGYGRGQLALFGLGAGSATLSFLSAAMLAASALRASVPGALVDWANAAVGAALVGYGLSRLVRTLRPKGRA